MTVDPAAAHQKKPKPQKVRHSAPGASRANACGNKQAFEDQAQASSAMMGFKKRQGIKAFFSVYKCRFCQKFHYGNGHKSGTPLYERRVNSIDRALARDAQIKARCEARAATE